MFARKQNQKTVSGCIKQRLQAKLLQFYNCNVIVLKIHPHLGLLFFSIYSLNLYYIPLSNQWINEHDDLHS
jgi:phosphoribosylpyrophosphate synthetase